MANSTQAGESIGDGLVVTNGTLTISLSYASSNPNEPFFTGQNINVDWNQFDTDEGQAVLLRMVALVIANIKTGIINQGA